MGGEKTAFRMGENNKNEKIDKELISKIHKQLMQLNTKKKKSNQKVGEIPKQTFFQRRNTDD